jgi:hypothetical protein
LGIWESDRRREEDRQTERRRKRKLGREHKRDKRGQMQMEGENMGCARKSPMCQAEVLTFFLVGSRALKG